MCNAGAARYLSPNGKRRAMSSVTDRNRQVDSMPGDGGFSMRVGDFLPLVQYDPPVEVVPFDNSALGAIELETSISGLPS